MAEDYYRLLGVTANASPDELKKAYRAKARELHPDANRDDPDAAEQFKRVAQAYEVLSDPEARARYDRYGEAGVSGNGAAGPNFGDMFGGAGLGDLLGTIFGGGSPFGTGGPSGPPRGQDLEVVADVTFEQSIFGATIPVTVHTAVRCDDCNGSGAGAGTQPVTCGECQGRGQVQRVRQSMLGQMVTATVCPKCGGLGEVVVTPCPTCGGDGRLLVDKTYQVDVPAGVDTGSTLRLSGRGAVGPRNGSPGDLYVHLRVAQSETFQRDGDDLVHVYTVSIAQAALGTRSMLTTPDGDVEVVVHPGTQPGREVAFRNKGVPRLRGRGRGDLRVLINVEVPTRLSEPEAELLRKLAEIRGEPVGVPEPGLFSRIKSAFQ
jgi:molecular chaperone DnaJ